MTTFVDLVRIKVRSGDGGNGIVAWRREKYEPLGGPAGGDGGAGGDVYLEAKQEMRTLLDFHYKTSFEAQVGARGGPKNKYGRQGTDLIIGVPVGTVVRDLDRATVIADLTYPGQKVLVAEGGQGGRGNTKLASSTRKAPHYCEPGQLGIERNLELELKLLADVGIIGLPNAGKSTLLSALTKARPKIADYPFSTLQPNLGVMPRPDGDGYVLADIPGLIKGAAQGIGLGHKFLRHVERTRLLIHLVDISSNQLEEDIKTVNDELSLYSKKLSQLKQILVLNKADLISADLLQSSISSLKQNYSTLMPDGAELASSTPLVISCATRLNLDDLSNLIFNSLQSLQSSPVLYEVSPDPSAREHIDSGFSITRKKQTFTVVSERVDRFVEVTNMRDSESLNHLHLVLKAMGIIKALVAEGAQPGTDVILGGVAFTFGDDW